MIPGQGGRGRRGPKVADLRGSSNVRGYEDVKQIEEVLSGGLVLCGRLSRMSANDQYECTGPDVSLASKTALSFEDGYPNPNFSLGRPSRLGLNQRLIYNLESFEPYTWNIS